MNDKVTNIELDFKSDKVSGCCQAKIIFYDICSDCKEHCDAHYEDEAEDEIYKKMLGKL